MTEAPAKFTDRAGREWTLQLDFACLQRIKDVESVDLGDAARIAETWSTLLYDDLKALAVTWLVIEPAATAKGVAKLDFLAAMDGGTLEQAIAALGGAVLSFTPPRKRGLAATAINRIQQGMTKAIASAETQLSTALEEAIEGALTAPGTSPTELLGSSATSIPVGL